jgi:streptogramin lyase
VIRPRAGMLGGSVLCGLAVVASVLPATVFGAPAISEYPIAAGAGAADVAAGPDSAIWFAETNRNQIARMPLPGFPVSEFAAHGSGAPAGSQPVGMATGEDGNLWFTEPANGRIARMTTAGAVAEATAFYAGDQPAHVAPGTYSSNGAMWYTVPNGNRVEVRCLTFQCGGATTLATAASDP